MELFLEACQFLKLLIESVPDSARAASNKVGPKELQTHINLKEAFPKTF
jgi:hypothetical protein